MNITLGCLYPDIMSTYGDRGNIAAIRRRCEWRGIRADVTELRLGDPVRPAELDLIIIGSGGESQQRLIAPDLSQVKGAAIREAVAGGAAALAVGGGFELFGRYVQPGEGTQLPGAEVFDAWTVGHRAMLDEHYDTLTEARADRAMGDLVVRWGQTLLVGFENHSGGTYLGESAKPLGQVVSGHGNNGDGWEGVLLGHAVGTHLRGPCLPKNPALADFLIEAALRRRHQDAELPALSDDLEQSAREAAMERAWQVRRRRVRPALLRRPAPRGRSARPRQGSPAGGRR